MIKNKERSAEMRGVKNSLLNTINTTRTLKTKMDQLKEKIDQLKALVENDQTQAVLTVEDVIYPGVSLRIGNANKKIDKEEYKVKFRNVEGLISTSPV
jgi:uncharacterized protein (DUF342 family)